MRSLCFWSELAGLQISGVLLWFYCICCTLEPVLTSDAGKEEAETEKAEEEEQEEEEGAGEEEEEEEEQKETVVSSSILLDLSEAPEEILPPSLERLWSYTCESTNGQSVSSMAWNKLNPVSYQIYSSKLFSRIGWVIVKVKY